MVALTSPLPYLSHLRPVFSQQVAVEDTLVGHDTIWTLRFGRVQETTSKILKQKASYWVLIEVVGFIIVVIDGYNQ